MLHSETAQERLKAFYVENWMDQQLVRAARLPGKLRGITRSILGRDADGKDPSTWTARRKAQDQGLEKLETLSQRDRRRIFEALFPQIANHVERAWQLCYRLPYQTGMDRKAFRAPNTPNTTSQVRGSWLLNLLSAVRGYQEKITWLAAWAPYLGWRADRALGILFAAAIEAGGEEGEAVFDILLASAQGEHEIGTMGRHVTRGLLVASRPEGWAFIEQLLLAAQRQEGLRQVILETVDEAHPEAFRRMLRHILEHNLTRFSATIRAVDVWFGMEWDAGDVRAVNEVIRHVLQFLDDPGAQTKALESDDGQTVYLALWSMAFEDAVATVEPASRLLNDPCAERRFIGVHLLGQLGLDRSQQALVPTLEDEDLRVVTRALLTFQRFADERIHKTDLFERIERIIPRFPRKKRELEPIVWPWLKLSTEQRMATGALIWNLGDRSPKRLIPYLPMMAPQHRATVVQRLAKMPPQDAQVRDTLLSLVGDRSNQVREEALQALADHRVTAQDAVRLEGLFTRKATDLRRGTLALLLNQADEEVLASAKRLLDAPHSLQRLAGLELLRQMIEKERLPGRCRTCAAEYRSKQSKITDPEAQLLDRILDKSLEVPTLDDALGLIDPTERTPPAPPRTRKLSIFIRQAPLITPAAIACLKALDDLVHQHRTTPVTLERWQGEQEELLGNIQWFFPDPKPDLPMEQNRARLPLQQVWETWWAQRPNALRDDDGLELLRALGTFFGGSRLPGDPRWLQKAQSVLFGSPDSTKPKYPQVVSGILKWLMYLKPPAGAVDFLLKAVETTFALIPKKSLAQASSRTDGLGVQVVSVRISSTLYDAGWRNNQRLIGWLGLARYHRSVCLTLWKDEHHIRLWRLLRWVDEPGPPVPRYRPHLEEVLNALEAGGATEADLLDHLLGARTMSRHVRGYFHDLWLLSTRKPHPLVEKHPILHALVSRCRDRILAVELNRGEMPTAASEPALVLRHAGGMEMLVRVLEAMGRERLTRGWATDNLSKASVFSHLIRATTPSASDTPEAFAAQVTAAKISQKRLIELAVYAPQWVNFVEHALGWPGLADAVWWVHAHTKDTRWHVDKEIREMWSAQVSEHTSLSSQELLDGAVDVAWFSRAYRALGPERWEQLYKAAKFASGGGGHARAQLFADAMLGRVGKADLVARITEKRHKDTVRALGLLPLAEGETRDRDLLERYRILQDFLRSSRKFGSQRQASEKLAAKIGMENLARTAGYPNPVRLEWAMEAQETADLVGGAKTVQAGEVTVTLAINRWGEPELTVKKKGKILRAIPAVLRKDPGIAELRARRKELKRQASRMRWSLEQAMERGDRFTGTELRELLTHPILAPMLAHLVFIGDEIIGYPVERGTALQFHDGTRSPLEEQTTLRVAHPYDLFTTQEWHHWQRECYLGERIQPFKQVFRELYLLTEAEKADRTISRRYAGHQVNPRQALALLGQRGWVRYPEEGVRRTFHSEGFSAWITFLEGFFTPAEVEGLTIEGVQFTQRGEWEPLPLTQVPPPLFSQVMRDLDLVVSVAHQGGVDPEASASTVEMRASLVRETCAMMGITNVELQGRHVLIEGALSHYTIHLGSAVVHQQPGGAVCIVPVHAQHRGRLFLPFVDDDPKTAEVLSKVLLLARDKDIKDPSILEQILRPLN